MNVLLLMIAYPDVSQNSSMYTDLAGELASNGYNVTVAVANGPKRTAISIEGGIKILRIRTFELFSTSVFRKGLANVLLPYQVTRGIRKKLQSSKFDVIIVSTPPITYLNTIKKLKTVFKSKVYLILRDIFPQNARDLGIIKSSLIFNFFRRKEADLYSVADYIGCMSSGNISYIIEHNPAIDQRKLHLLPNWKNVAEYTPSELKLKKQYGFENKYVVIYGGNLGKPQQLDAILDLAKEVIYLKDVVFLLIGNGTEKQRIINYVKKNSLNNVEIRDPIPRHNYEELVKICDIGLVNTSSRFTIPNIPSRTLSYWEAKIAVLASIDKNTDFNKILEDSGSGLWSITGDLSSYKHNFEKLYFNKELRISMGEKGYKYLIENCTTAKAFSIIQDKIIS